DKIPDRRLKAAYLEFEGGLIGNLEPSPVLLGAYPGISIHRRRAFQAAFKRSFQPLLVRGIQEEHETAVEFGTVGGWDVFVSVGLDHGRLDLNSGSLLAEEEELEIRLPAHLELEFPPAPGKIQSIQLPCPFQEVGFPSLL